MGSACGCPRRLLTDQQLAQALLRVGEHLADHDDQIDVLGRQQLRLGAAAEEAAGQILQHAKELSEILGAPPVAESSAQTEALPELAPVWAAWDTAGARPWSADLAEAEAARRRRVGLPVSEAREAASSSGAGRRTDTPRVRGPTFWVRDEASG